MHYINRPPRIQPPMPQNQVKVPSPPTSQSALRSWMTLLLPLLMSGAYVLMFLLRPMGGGRTILFMLPMMLVMGFSGVLSYWNWKQTKRAEEQKEENYRDSLKKLREHLMGLHDQQRHFYDHTRPPSATVTQFVAHGEVRDTRLWERRPTDADFGLLRMGWGRLPSTVEIEVSGSDSNAPLMPLATRLAEEFTQVSEAAICLQLRRLHAIGIVSPRHEWSVEFTNALLVHYAGTHAPDEAQIFIAGAPSTKSYWNWARWLPHSNSTYNEEGSGDHLCFDTQSITQLWDTLQDELERRSKILEQTGNRENTLPPLPLLLVIVDGYAGRSSSQSPLQEVEAEAAVSTLLWRGSELGAGLIFIVPEREQIPSECNAVIEVEVDAQGCLSFRYAETGVNSPRHDGVADRISSAQAEQFARNLTPFILRTTHGADLPKAVTLLETLNLPHNSTQVESYIKKCWCDNRTQSGFDEQVDRWPHTVLGMIASNKPLQLTLTSQLDGVHGLLAGTTGSGKSELLQSIILSIAMHYDPRQVHFVLIDFKGGTAFEVLRPLPHTVGITTNLQGQLGARTFIALKAELARRQGILNKYKPGDIRTYYKKRHPDDPELPHLFVIIDEFAEMIKAMPDFKTDLISIAALGRALGVHLILATQNPEGVVSDQIRSNMKFRICLRVEQPTHSREVLGRADAAFLPPNIPGRAYLQIGTDNVQLFQGAYSGGPPYQELVAIPSRPIVRFPNREKHHVEQEPANKGPENIAEALIWQMQHLAKQENIKKQEKPWPDPLPARLYLPRWLEPVQAWQDGTGAWQEALDWKNAMRPLVGLLDDPANMEQPDFIIRLQSNHTVIFGAPGWGKTCFLRTLITSLAATHSPADLHFYILDFGNLGLRIFKDLPHVGHVIYPGEDEQIQRLLRKLSNEIDLRRHKFSQAHAGNLYDYNREVSPAERLPAICIVLDNLAEFTESYPSELDILASLARGSIKAGIHLIFTADQLRTMPSKMYNHFGERLTLHLADSSEYMEVVGRRVSDPEEYPGRGFVRRGRSPLEFQIALPVASAALASDDVHLEDNKDETIVEESNQVARLEAIIKHMNAAWQDKLRPEPIRELSNFYPLADVLEQVQTTPSAGLCPVLGIDDMLQPVEMNLNREQHFVVLGGPLSGKTTALRTWILSLATRYAPDNIGIVLVDVRGRLARLSNTSRHSLAELPHVLYSLSPSGSLDELCQMLKKEFDYREERREKEPVCTFPDIFVVIDDYDFLPPQNPASIELSDLARMHGASLHIAIGAMVTGNATTTMVTDPLLRVLRGMSFGLSMGNAEIANSAFGVRIRLGAPVEMPVGRGYLVQSGQDRLVQVATPGNEEVELDMWVDQLDKRYNQRAAWTNPDLNKE